MIKHYDLATGEAIDDQVAGSAADPVGSSLHPERRLMTVEEAVAQDQASQTRTPPALLGEDIENIIARQHY